LFDAPAEIYVQGCNTFNNMGSGVAGIVAREYPGAVAVDKLTIKGDKTKLGTYTHWSGNHARFHRTVTIVNAYTQHEYGGGKVHADYNAIQKVMEKINADFPTQTIAMPRIGAGLARGDWNRILSILETVFHNREVVVYVHPKDVV